METIKPGQVWLDNDKRIERQIRVIEVRDGRVYYSSVLGNFRISHSAVARFEKAFTLKQ